jgi:hypothetical protein
MAQKPLPLLSREWRQSAKKYADEMGLGPLDSLPAEQWKTVLKKVEMTMQTEGVVMPDGWQAALAKQVGRADA